MKKFCLRTLTHEIGHTLGFGERYGHTRSGTVASHERFQDDFMGNVSWYSNFQHA